MTDETEDGDVLTKLEETTDFPECIKGKELEGAADLDPMVMSQLREFVASIAGLCTSVPFTTPLPVSSTSQFPW